MKNQSRILPVALIIAVIAFLLTWRGQRANGQSRAALEHENRVLREQLAAARGAARQLANDLRHRIDLPVDTAAPVPAGDVIGGAVHDTFIGPGGMPEFQRLHAMHERAALDGRFAALFQALKLNPEKLERLKNLLVEREVSAADVFSAAATQGINLHDDPEGLKRAIANAQREVDRSIQSLLGDESYAAYEQYRQTLGERSIVDQLQQRLSYTPEPLTAAQAAQLITILAATNSSSGNGGNLPNDAIFFSSGGPAPMMNGTPISDEAIAQAGPLLSAEQLRALQEIQQTQRAQQELMRQLGPPGGSVGVTRPIGGARRGKF